MTTGTSPASGTTMPDPLTGIFARYREIAPRPFPDGSGVAQAVSRSLVVHGLRLHRRAQGTRAPLDVESACAAMAASAVLARFRESSPEDAELLCRRIAAEWLDERDIAARLHHEASALGVSPEEVTELAGTELWLSATREASDAERAGKAERACQTLGHVVELMSRDLYAAWIDVARDDMAAVRERVLNAQPDCDDLEPGDQWNGTETGDEWFDRTLSDADPGRERAEEPDAGAVAQAKLAAISAYLDAQGAKAALAAGRVTSSLDLTVDAADIIAIIEAGASVQTAAVEPTAPPSFRRPGFGLNEEEDRNGPGHQSRVR